MPSNQKEVDFSNFFKNQATSGPKQSAGNSPQKRKSSRIVFMVIILIILMGVEVWLVLSSRPKPAAIPTGYEWVYPANAPAYIAPIKK